MAKRHVKRRSTSLAIVGIGAGGQVGVIGVGGQVPVIGVAGQVRVSRCGWTARGV